jgi:hypothetical protein
MFQLPAKLQLFFFIANSLAGLVELPKGDLRLTGGRRFARIKNTLLPLQIKIE